MKAYRVLSKEDLSRLWSVLEPKFRKVSDKHPEHATPAEIYNLYMAGGCDIFYAVDEVTNELCIVLAVERQVERGRVYYFIISVGGERFDEFMNTCRKDICSWMQLNGASSIEGLVRPSMYRLLQKHGWASEFCLARFML